MKRFTLLALLVSAILGSTVSAAEQFSTRTYQLADFTIIDVSNVVKVVYTQADSYNVQLTGRTDWLDLMEVTSKGGKLTVKAKNSKKFNNAKKKDKPDGEHNFILHLTAPCLENIQLSGVSTFEAKRFTTDGLFVRLDGVSKFKVESVEGATIKANLHGCSELHLSEAVTQKWEMDVEGSSKLDVQRLTATEAYVSLHGASKANLPTVVKAEKATLNVGGASSFILGAETTGLMQVGLSGASKGELTYKGGQLRTWCTGASKLSAQVNCTSINANCDGASKTTFSGTADKVEIDRGGVAVNIDTSRLNQF